MTGTKIMLCASKGCSNPRIKDRTLCYQCKAAREDMVKVTCANDGCKHVAAMDSHQCRFCNNRDAAMAAAHKPNTTGVSKCCHCNETKPVVNFSVNSATASALDYTCKQCRATQKAAKFDSEDDVSPEEKTHFGFEKFGGNKLSALLSKPLGAIAQQLSGEQI